MKQKYGIKFMIPLIITLLFSACGKDVSESEAIMGIEEQNQEISVVDMDSKVEDPIELTLSISTLGMSEKAIINAFNDKKTGYYIKAIEENLSDEQIWEELKSGQGKDIYSISPDFCENPQDYFLPLKNINEKEYCVPIAFYYGEDNQLYGIRKSYQVVGYAIPRSKYDYENKPGVKSLMEAVECSDAEVFALEVTPEALVYELIQVGKTDGFIDWEKKRCNFDNDEFYALLDFGEKYGDTGTLVGNREVKLAREGKVFASIRTITQPTDLYYLDELMNEEVYCLGFSGSNGNSFETYEKYYAGNANSKYIEGIQLFLDFLLSDEAQKIVLKNSCGFPIRFAQQERLITKSIGMGVSTMNGVTYEYPETMDSFHKNQFAAIVQNTVSLNYRENELRRNIYHILADYYAGKLSPSETAQDIEMCVEHILWQ